jgi:hypothetical protein
MPNGTITSTENTFGTVNGALSGTVAGTLTGSVGVPGPQGPPGPGSTWGTILGTLSAQTDLWSELGTKYLASNPAGYQTAGQVSTALAPYITSATATASFYPLTGNPSAFLQAAALSPYLLSATAASTYYPLSNPSNFATQSFVTGQGYITSAALSPYLLSATAATSYYPLTGNPSSFLTASALTGYATESWVTSGFATTARGQPASGTVGQVLTKNSGTNYDSSWQTLIPGDRYLTSSTTSNTIGNGTKTFTVGTGLSYSSQQDVVISFNASNHMHALVTSYNSGTGVLVVDVQHHTGSGTYTAWTVNVGGTTPLQSVEWGEILGVLGDQGDLATAINSKLESSTAASTYAALAGATFTGEVVTPASTTANAGIQITPGVAPSAPQNGEIWATTNDLQVRLNGVTETLAEQSWVTSQGYLTSAPVTSVAGKTGAVSLVVGDVSGAAALAGATFTGLVTTVAPTTTTAGLNLPHGTAPTTPVNGDLWTTSSGLFFRINGGTQSACDLGSTQTISGNKTFSNASLTLGNSTAAATYNLGTGATLTATTKAINIGTNGVSGSTTNITLGSTTGTNAITLNGPTTLNGTITTASTSITLGNNTAASTVNVGTGATISGSTKSVNIGTAGVAGSTTNVTIGTNSGGTNAHTIHGPTTINGNITATGTTLDLGNSTAASTISLGAGATATATTKAVNIGTNGASGSTTNIAIGSTTGTSTTTLQGNLTTTGTTTDIGNSTAAQQINIGSGGTLSGSTKNISIGNNGASGSTTNLGILSSISPPSAGGTIIIGTNAQTTTTLNGTTNGVTLSADTNTTGLATTAFVVGQAGSATPLVDGTAAVGTSLRYARQDHVHPTDTSRAALASPTFTGVPAAPTAAVDTNTTQIATTAFVVGQASAATPLVDGTAAVGTSLRYARADHVHPTDTTRAAVNSPAFTGTPSLPTGTTAVTQTAGNNTTAVATTAFVAAAVPAVATASQARSFTSNTTAMSPRQVLWSMLTPDVNHIGGQAMTTTNVGTISFVNNGMLTRWTRPGTAGACSSRTRSFGPSQVDQVLPFTSRASAANNIGFSQRIIMSGRSYIGGVTEANLTTSIYMGKDESDAVGDLTRRGIGWKMTGGAGSRFLLLQAHNGTTLSSVTSSFAVTEGVAFDWDVESDGAGNVTLYVNGSSVATSTGGPTGNSSGNLSFWNEEISASAALTSQFCAFINSRSKFAVINSW